MHKIGNVLVILAITILACLQSLAATGWFGHWNLTRDQITDQDSTDSEIICLVISDDLGG